MIKFEKFFLLSEGGAAGHTWHPFDVPTIKTGAQLITAFNKMWQSVSQNPPAVKIDGINVSFKVVGNQFALDRGSMKPIDVVGITIDRVGERFPEGHGMRDAANTMLSFLNDSFSESIPELKKLGLISNPNKFINAEYVSGQTNVTSYNKAFLAFHGINEFVQVTPARRQSHEVDYDKKALDSFAEKVKPFAKKYGFDVVTSIPAKTKGKPNFQQVLNQPYTVIYGENNPVTKPLGEWLKQAKNPFGYMYTTQDGKKVGALSKFTYLNILNQLPLTQFVKDEKDYQMVIDGSVIYHATRVLGAEVLRHLTSDMGDVENHEGIMVRGVFGRPVKITGDFIVKGMESAFRK
jgi:hypothetical protein